MGVRYLHALGAQHSGMGGSYNRPFGRDDLRFAVHDGGFV